MWLHCPTGVMVDPETSAALNQGPTAGGVVGGFANNLPPSENAANNWPGSKATTGNHSTSRGVRGSTGAWRAHNTNTRRRRREKERGTTRNASCPNGPRERSRRGQSAGHSAPRPLDRSFLGPSGGETCGEAQPQVAAHDAREVGTMQGGPTTTTPTPTHHHTTRARTIIRWRAEAAVQRSSQVPRNEGSDL